MSDTLLQTRGRVLLKAAAVYDLLQPVMMLGSGNRLMRLTAEQAAPAKDERILDVGCGTGLLAHTLAVRNPSATFVGIDASAPMVRVATRKRSRANCSFKAALAEDLPFEDESFDAVVSSLFFHHVDADLKGRSLQEIRRVLRPGGRLIVADMGQPYTLFGRVLAYGAWMFFEQPEIMENIKGLLPEMIKDCGFIDLREAYRSSGYIYVYTARKESDA